MFKRLKRWLVGSPLPSASAAHERLTKVVALAVFSSDALSSVAYATQEILYQLIAAGPAGVALCLPIACGIAALLVIVSLSYSQTIRAYPGGGGSYRVAKENLGTLPGLVAAASILIDYVLTVAVSSAAGIAAVTSAVPSLFPHRTILCIVAVLIVATLNLRGMKESGAIFAVPTYVFIAGFGLLLVGAFSRYASGTLAPIDHPAEWDAHLASAAQPITLWLIMRSYAAGCTALTGIEAIADGVPAFHAPESRNARITLGWMATILCTYFLGASWLATHMGAYPHETETVISQIARATFGPGAIYFLIQASTATILILAVNTSFADFPRLSSILARDRFLPRQFSNQGDRLVFSNGIVFLSGFSILLLILFKGDTHALLPLYAVGVFMSFTLSQAGMVMRHLKRREAGWRIGLAINMVGAIVTSIVLVIIAATKFTHGAWVVIIIIPVFVLAFLKVHAHYMRVRDQLSLEGASAPEKIRNTVIIPVSSIHRGVVTALQYANAISDDVRAVMINLDPEATERMRDRWPRWGCGVPLIVLDSPYRSIVRPLLEYIDSVDRRIEADVITIVLPEFVPARWWEHLLHNQTALAIKGSLLFRRNTIVTSVPYHLDRPGPGSDSAEGDDPPPRR